MKKVFLGGTCNGSTWRDDLIPEIKIDYFNPVVTDWTEDCMAEEINQRQNCDFVPYVITPKMTGSYSIAEAVDDSNKRPERTLFCTIDEDDRTLFTDFQRKSLRQVSELIKSNGGTCFCSLHAVAQYLNRFANVSQTVTESRVFL